MLREHCKIGMKVIFGRPNGEKTIGEVVKIGPKKAKVKTLEARGYFFRKNSGVKWSVPFGLMEHLDGRLEEALLSLPPKDDDEDVKRYLVEGSKPLPYTHWNYPVDSLILQAIFLAYKNRKSLFARVQSLNPQNRYDKIELEGLEDSLRNFHNPRLKSLFLSLGRPVSEAVACAWKSEAEIQKIAMSAEGVDPHQASRVATFLAEECRSKGIAPSPPLAHRAMQDFKMWKSGITENHWSTLVRSDVENHTGKWTTPTVSK